MHARLLIVEDNRDILTNLTDYLTLKGFETDCAQDGLSALHLAATQHYDLIIMDVMLPGMEGYTLCERLREGERSDTPIIMLTARDTLDDRLHGFRAGADDYLTKPFSLAELVARIEAILKRSQGKRRRVLSIADLEYDLDTLSVTRGHQPVRLTPVGLKLLMILMQRSPAVVHREILEQALWGDTPPDSDSLRSHVHALRLQLDKPFPNPLLHTVHGIGYRIAISDHEH